MPADWTDPETGKVFKTGAHRRQWWTDQEVLALPPGATVESNDGRNIVKDAEGKIIPPPEPPDDAR